MSEKVESGLEVATFWVLFDATAEQRFIKKDTRDGTLAFFDSEHQAIRAKRAHADTDYKRVDYVRQSDAERAVQLEMERHRKTWRQLGQVTGLLKDTTAVAITMLYDSHKADVLSEFKVPELEVVVKASEHLQALSVEKVYRRAWDAALSLQSEPVCSRCDGFGKELTVYEGGIPCRVCQAEPAPAQDERDLFGTEKAATRFCEQRGIDDDSPYRDRALDAFTSGAAWQRLELAARPAQTEQQPTVKHSLTVEPMAYAVFAANGNVACFSTRRDHPSLVALESDGHSVVSLAPIANAEQQLFTVPDGYVLVPEDQIIESDDYGIYGSTFHYCKLCQSESGAGMLNKGIPHKPGCALSTPSPAMDAKEE